VPNVFRSIIKVYEVDGAWELSVDVNQLYTLGV
jgi:hypothetical protein